MLIKCLAACSEGTQFTRLAGIEAIEVTGQTVEQQYALQNAALGALFQRLAWFDYEQCSAEQTHQQWSECQQKGSNDAQSDSRANG